MDKDLDIENHSKFDLAYMINKLLKERMDIIILLQKTNQERIVKIKKIVVEIKISKEIKGR